MVFFLSRVEGFFVPKHASFHAVFADSILIQCNSYRKNVLQKTLFGTLSECCENSVLPVRWYDTIMMV